MKNAGGYSPREMLGWFGVVFLLRVASSKSKTSSTHMQEIGAKMVGLDVDLMQLDINKKHTQNSKSEVM